MQGYFIKGKEKRMQDFHGQTTYETEWPKLERKKGKRQSSNMVKMFDGVHT